ncbi:MAG: UDP-N-acetylmuramoyl-tripeptide-D-alanyl-D-alanine ligase [Candidatus Saccharibacteria bacterium]|nr:UDP-N-acetylmuramoyl-tripeptide-D-alanyl-D-alanine ligase [Candidatus Saccharibacteria bacterium]
MLKRFIQTILEGYVKKYLARHPDITLIIVTGSVGKTSTKVAVATVLSERFRVRLHEGNHNAELSAPLAILGIEYPDNIRSLSAWMAVFKAARQRIKNPTDTDVIVQEVGSDRIGQVPHFGTYARPGIAVITAVSPEHMEYFGTIEEVAKEELAAANFSEKAIINRDDISGQYASILSNPNVTTYGTSASAEYYFTSQDFDIERGHRGQLVGPRWDEPIAATIKVLGEHNLRPAVAAAAVADSLGMTPTEIRSGLEKVQPVSGRMNMLRGMNDTLLIDDTYNSSPLAASSALQALYQLTVPQRIAVLGSMNELGSSSVAEHQAIGKMCDPNQLAWVITVGKEAREHLAPAAKANGCQVASFDSAIEAGGFVHQHLEKGAAVLFKGSQGGVYLEEAVKVLLHSTDDEAKLVRQSPQWLKDKKAFFESLA